MGAGTGTRKQVRASLKQLQWQRCETKDTHAIDIQTCDHVSALDYTQRSTCFKQHFYDIHMHSGRKCRFGCTGIRGAENHTFRMPVSALSGVWCADDGVDMRTDDGDRAGVGPAFQFALRMAVDARTK